MFRSFQIIIREFRLSLLKLLHIHDLVRFCKQGVVAAYAATTPCLQIFSNERRNSLTMI